MAIRVPVDVEMRGVRKHKQQDKMDAAIAECARKLKGGMGLAQIAKKVKAMNAEILARVEKHNAEAIRNWVRTYADASNWEWDGDAKVELDEINEQIQKASSLLDSLFARRSRIQKKEMREAVKNSEDIHDEVKDAFEEEIQKKGINSRRMGPMILV